MTLKLMTLATSLLMSPLAIAQSYEQITLSSEVSKVIDNDEMHATLSKTVQVTNAKTLATTLNSTLNQAMTIAKKYPDVKVVTGQQTSYPRHNKDGKMVGLTGMVSINLESQNFEQTGEILGELQAIMTMDNISFQVSEKSRQHHQKELMNGAIARFKQDAKDAALAFGAKDYKLVNVTLDHQNAHYPVLRSVAMKEMASDATMQNLSAGDSTLRYQVSGTIELVR